MKQEEALQHLREFLWGLQRYRSIAMETLLGPGTGDICLTDALAAEMWPWVFGEKCPLPALAKIIDSAETNGILSPLDYYNMMIVFDRFMPEVKASLLAWRGVPTVPEGPPDVSVLTGWDDRSGEIWNEWNEVLSNEG